jgi:hypothetical protein
MPPKGRRFFETDFRTRSQDSWTFISLVKSKGFSERKPQIPWPHEHRYNEEFDASENDITEYLEWKSSPLKEYDNL